MKEREKGRKKHLFNKIGLHNWQSKSIVRLNKQANIYHLQREKERENSISAPKMKREGKNRVVYYFDVIHFVCYSFDAYNIEIRHTNVESFKSGHKMSMFLPDIYKLGKHILS